MASCSAVERGESSRKVLTKKSDGKTTFPGKDLHTKALRIGEDLCDRPYSGQSLLSLRDMADTH